MPKGKVWTIVNLKLEVFVSCQARHQHLGPLVAACCGSCLQKGFRRLLLRSCVPSPERYTVRLALHRASRHQLLCDAARLHADGCRPPKCCPGLLEAPSADHREASMADLDCVQADVWEARRPQFGCWR